MLHGPCGMSNKSSPCMKNGRCSRFFPKKIQEITVINQDGFVHYRRKTMVVTLLRMISH